VRGWATLVARVFQRLPDLPALRQVERRAEALQSNLDIAEQRAADDFAARLAQFVHTKGKGVSGP
jgi:hypothetical protein